MKMTNFLMKPQWPFPMIWLVESWVPFGLLLQSILKPKYLVQLKEAFQDHSTWGMSFRQFLSFYDVIYHYVTSHNSKWPNYPVFSNVFYAAVIFEHLKNCKNEIFVISKFWNFCWNRYFQQFDECLQVYKQINGKRCTNFEKFQIGRYIW